MRLASTVVAIVRKEVSRRKNILSITRAVKSKLMTDESFAKTEFLSTKRTRRVQKKSVLWSILSNSSVSRTMSGCQGMSSLIDSFSTAKLVHAIITNGKRRHEKLALIFQYSLIDRLDMVCQCYNGCDEMMMLNAVFLLPGFMPGYHFILLCGTEWRTMITGDAD